MPIPPKDTVERVVWYGRRVGLTLAGTAVLALGVVAIFFPGPATLLIPFGLALLSAAGFAWAQRAQASAKREGRRQARNMRRRLEVRRRGPRVDVRKR